MDTVPAPVVGVADGLALAAWTEDVGSPQDLLVARRVSADGMLGPRLEAGACAN